MVELVGGDDLRKELSDFYTAIDDNVISKLKDLCVIHNISADTVCAELVSFVLKYDKKDLNLEVIEDFQTDYLDKKAIQDYKKSKTPIRPRAHKTNALSANKSINLFMNQIKSPELERDSNQGVTHKIKEPKEPKLTTKIEVASNDSDIEEFSTQTESEENVDQEKEKVNQENSIIECMDISSQSSPLPVMDDTINTSLKCTQNSNVLSSYGSQYSEDEWINRSKVKYSVELFDKNIGITDKYKFMSLKIVEANEVLNDKIDEFSEEIRQTLDIENWSQFSHHSPSESYYIGRVSHDCTNNKLDEHSIRFETSAFISNNESIRLDVSRLKSFSLFAGQVLACKAINEWGNSLFVQEMIDSEKVLTLPKTVPELKKAIHIAVAVGPFNDKQSLNFEYLKKFIEYCRKYEPDFCIIIGPFVDSMNEMLMTSEESIDRLFSLQMRFISDQLSDVKTEAIIIPSTRDLNVFNVLPTMPFDPFISPKLHYFSNPSVLQINGIVIGITSTDVLLHLSKEEISVGQTSDRLSRLCKHIISQKNFYPIFPPNPEINLEFTKYQHLTLPVTPHILILPSDLKEFIKSICVSVVINSGRLTKSKFCRIRVDPFDQKSYNGSLESFTNVEIIKIDV